MKTIVLASGLGTRLAPLTATLPKPLVPVLNYPVLGHVLAGLRQAGLRDIGVTIGPHAHHMRRYFDDGHRLGLRLTWLEDTGGVVGTGGTLRDHAWFFDNQPALVVCADMLNDLDPIAVIRHYHTHPATVTVAVHPVDRATWPGDIIHADGHHGLAYQLKPGPARARSRLGSTGTWIIDPAILADLPAHGHVDFSSDVLPNLPNSHRSLGVYHAGPTRLRDFGRFDTYHQGNMEALHGHHHIRPAGAQISPNVWIEAGSRICPTATLTSPLAIGRHVTIGAHAQITGPAIIGHGASIGAHAAIIDSVILPGATIADDTLIANAVSGNPHTLVSQLVQHR